MGLSKSSVAKARRIHSIIGYKTINKFNLEMYKQNVAF